MYQFHFLYDAIKYEKLPTVYYVNVPRLYTKVLIKMFKLMDKENP